MVKLSILPATVKTFPYTGYLGLSPVKVEGCVCTVLSADGKPLLAKSITISIRCYESRLGRVSALQTNVLVDHTEELWSKSDGQEYSEIAELELPFRITLPAHFGGRSTTTFPNYRIYWRIEAIINHIPIAGVGCRLIKHYSLPWIRYDVPPIPLDPPTPLPVLLDSKTTKPRAPAIRYNVKTPACPVGPLDLVSITVHLLPVDPAVSIRSASLIVERLIQFIETSTPPSPRGSDILIPASPPPLLSPSLSTLTSDSETSRAVSQSTSRSPSPVPSAITDKGCNPLIPSVPPPASIPSDSHLKTVATSVAGVESSGRFARDTSGVWTKTLTFQWPAAKSTSRWAIGETLQTDMASVKFFVRVKIVVSSPSGTESIELSDRELIVVATNAAERELAVSKYTEMQAASCAERARAKSKSKSPRRRRREHTHNPVPIDSTPPGTTTPGVVSNTVGAQPQVNPRISSKTSKSKRSSSRRPHTSTGLLEKTHTFDHTAVCTFKAEERPRDKKSRKRSADVANAESTSAEEESSSQMKVEGTLLDVRNVIVPSTHPPDHAVYSMEAEPQEEAVASGKRSSSTPSDHVRAWEEELARIESRSRRGSVEMMSFAHKLKRITTDRFMVRVPVLAHSEG